MELQKNYSKSVEQLKREKAKDVDASVVGAENDVFPAARQHSAENALVGLERRLGELLAGGGEGGQSVAAVEHLKG